jgi:hypothetical protein
MDKNDISKSLGEYDGWISVIRKLPSETMVCEVHTIFGHTYNRMKLVNGVWCSPLDGDVDCVDFWREGLTTNQA